jgi:hypothetical protein
MAISFGRTYNSSPLSVGFERRLDPYAAELTLILSYYLRYCDPFNCVFSLAFHEMTSQ